MIVILKELKNYVRNCLGYKGVTKRKIKDQLNFKKSVIMMHTNQKYFIY